MEATDGDAPSATCASWISRRGSPAPYATKLLADAGALVTKVEPPGGDYTRRLGPFPGDVPDPEQSGLYLHLNTSKRSVTLDVSVTSGQVVLKKLLANADVFVCGEKASTLKAWGCPTTT